MLDKDQIQDWDGSSEKPAPKSKPAPVPPAAPIPPVAKATATAIPEIVLQYGEAKPTGEFVKQTPEQIKARRRRGQWIALGLFAFVIVLFVLTMTKIGGRIVNWGGAFTPEQGTPIE